MKEQLLTQLRDRALSLIQFRTLSASLSKLMASEIASQIGYKPIILIPILRAGLVLLPAFQEFFKGAPIGFLGIRREEKTARPRLYYQNLPSFLKASHALILDPMLATGGTANLAIQILKNSGATSITLVTVIAAPEGIQAVRHRYPEVEIYTVAIDERLDAQKFIFPGLGDFGDRYFGTMS